MQLRSKFQDPEVGSPDIAQIRLSQGALKKSASYALQFSLTIGSKGSLAFVIRPRQFSSLAPP